MALVLDLDQQLSADYDMWKPKQRACVVRPYFRAKKRKKGQETSLAAVQNA